jgi:cytoskeletal protein RodZ
MSTDPPTPAPEAPAAPSVPSQPSAPESFGQYLLRERELRGVSLKQISEQTRIGTSHLKALEQDDPSRLPARVFVLGHIKAYAHAIGLNPDDAVLRYEEQNQKSRPPVEEEAGPRARKGWLLAALAFAGALVVGVAFFLWRLRR